MNDLRGMLLAPKIFCSHFARWPICNVKCQLLLSSVTFQCQRGNENNGSSLHGIVLQSATLNTRASFQLPDYRDFNLSLECLLCSITTPTGCCCFQALQMDTCDFDNEVSNPHLCFELWKRKIPTYNLCPQIDTHRSREIPANKLSLDQLLS